MLAIALIAAIQWRTCTIDGYEVTDCNLSKCVVEEVRILGANSPIIVDLIRPCEKDIPRLYETKPRG